MTWDAKITTFPGLYLMGTAAGWARRALGLLAWPQTRSTHFCDTSLLRGVNAILAIACLPVFYFLAAALDPRRTQLQLLLMASHVYPLMYIII
jgi:alpha-1,2-glucosyltransferase